MADHEAIVPNKFVPSVGVRKYIYGILVAAGALGVIYGLVNIEQLGAWLVLGAAVLGLSNGLALANTPHKTSGT